MKNTVNYKLANYSKLAPSGIIKENVYVQVMMLLLVKLFLIKKIKIKNISLKIIVSFLKVMNPVQFQSVCGINGDGYNFCKVQIKMNVIHKLVIPPGWTKRNYWNGLSSRRYAVYKRWYCS